MVAILSLVLELTISQLAGACGAPSTTPSAHTLLVLMKRGLLLQIIPLLPRANVQLLPVKVSPAVIYPPSVTAMTMPMSAELTLLDSATASLSKVIR